MKARIKATGEVLTVIGTSGSSKEYHMSDGNTYKEKELDFTDWRQYRIQAAIAAMHTIAQSLGSIDYNKDLIAKHAVELADALVKELKKGQD